MSKGKKRVYVDWQYINKKGELIPKEKVHEIRKPKNDKLYPFRPEPRGARWGYKNAKGKVIIEPQFGNAHPFIDGLALAEQVENWQPAKGSHEEVGSGLYGLIDKKGKFVVKPVYENAFPFSDGLAAVQKNAKWGYINTKGKVVIKCKYPSVMPFSEGLASVQIGDSWGYIDKNDILVIKADFKWANMFSEGYADIAVVEDNETKWGFINRKGEIVIKPQFGEVKPFSEEFAAVKIIQKRRKTGKADFTQDDSSGRWGFIDKKGKVKIKPSYDDVIGFSQGLAAVMKDGKKGWNWGFINKKGEVVVKLKWDRATSFASDGIAMVGMITDTPYYYLDEPITGD